MCDPRSPLHRHLYGFVLSKENFIQNLNLLKSRLLFWTTPYSTAPSNSKTMVQDDCGPFPTLLGSEKFKSFMKFVSNSFQKIFCFFIFSFSKTTFFCARKNLYNFDYNKEFFQIPVRKISAYDTQLFSRKFPIVHRKFFHKTSQRTMVIGRHSLLHFMGQKINIAVIKNRENMYEKIFNFQTFPKLH